MSKKYKFTGEPIKYYGHILHRIVALKDFGNIKKGDIGGWIEREENLSQEGKCWVYENAKVYGRAQVYSDAKIFDNARVYDKAQVSGEAIVGCDAQVYDEAQVYSDAKIFDNAKVYGNAKVCGEAQVYNKSLVYDEAQVYDNVQVCGDAEVGGKTEIYGRALLCSGATKTDDDYVVVGPQGRRHAYTTYQIPSDTVCTRCFSGTLEEFKDAVEKTHKNNEKYRKQYEKIINLFNAYKTNDK